MKKISILILIINIFPKLYGQEYYLPIDTVSNNLEYSESVKINKSKTELFAKLNSWDIEKYDSVAILANYDLEETDHCRVTRILQELVGVDSQITYNLTISYKDGGFECIVDSISPRIRLGYMRYPIRVETINNFIDSLSNLDPENTPYLETIANEAALIKYKSIGIAINREIKNLLFAVKTHFIE